MWLLFHRPLILLGLVALAAVWLYLGGVRYERRFRQKGYRSGHRGRDEVFYQELFAGATRELVIPGEMTVGGPHLVYVPSDREWYEQMPEWARARKVEILSRMKEELGARDHEFVEG